MLAIIAAFKIEIKGFLKTADFRVTSESGPLRFLTSEPGNNVVAVYGALGKERATRATETVISRYDANVVVSTGFAGGVRPGLRTGQVVICEDLFAIDSEDALWDPDALKRRACHVPTPDLIEAMNRNLVRQRQRPVGFEGCISLHDIAMSSRLKKLLGLRLPVGAVDMESYWVCETAQRNKVAQMVLRSVLDTVEQDLPGIVVSGGTGDGNIGPADAMRYLVRHPEDIPATVGLAARARTAQKSLSSCLQTITDMYKEGDIYVVSNDG